MDFDFELILVILTLVSGGIWALDRLLWASARESKSMDKDSVREPVIVEYAHSLFPVFLIVLILRSFIAEPYQIPSGSMKPTLLIGDFIIVNKFSYGVRLPVLENKVFSTGEPQRGDVMVFRYPKDNETNYIKRVIGIPGDHVRYSNKTLYINGKAMPQKLVAAAPGECERRVDPNAIEKTEDLDGVIHHIYICGEGSPFTYERTVPKGNYLVFGDNRDNSNDSRYWDFVPEENLVGKATMIWFSSNPDNDWFSGDRVRWDRIGSFIE